MVVAAGQLVVVHADPVARLERARHRALRVDLEGHLAALVGLDHQLVRRRRDDLPGYGLVGLGHRRDGQDEDQQAQYT